MKNYKYLHHDFSFLFIDGAPAATKGVGSRVPFETGYPTPTGAHYNRVPHPLAASSRKGGVLPPHCPVRPLGLYSFPSARSLSISLRTPFTPALV